MFMVAGIDAVINGLVASSASTAGGVEEANVPLDSNAVYSSHDEGNYSKSA